MKCRKNRKNGDVNFLGIIIATLSVWLLLLTIHTCTEGFKHPEYGENEQMIVYNEDEDICRYMLDYNTIINTSENRNDTSWKAGNIVIDMYENTISICYNAGDDRICDSFEIKPTLDPDTFLVKSKLGTKTDTMALTFGKKNELEEVLIFGRNEPTAYNQKYTFKCMSKK